MCVFAVIYMRPSEKKDYPTMCVFAVIYMRPSEKKDYLVNLLIGMDIWGEWSSAWIQGHSVCSSMEMGRPGSEAVHGDILYVYTTLLIYFFTTKRYGRYAKRAETQAIRAGLFTSAVMGGLFFLGLGMFGIAFWYVEAM